MVIVPTLDAFVNFNPKVGTEGLHITGFPGSGKSNMANRIFLDCMKRQNMGLLRGDRFAEWRHLVNYLNKYELRIIVLMPENYEDYEMVNFPDFNTLAQYGVIFQLVKYPIVNIMEFMNEGTIVVVCDFMLDLKDKGWLWVGIFEQLINRVKNIDMPITYLDHEAGIMLPEIALSDTKKSRSHWMAVNRMCELYVDFRKALIRPIFVSQLEHEIKHQIREKCIFRIHRQGIVSHRNPENIQKRAPKLPLNHYIITIGRELYNPNCTVRKFKETTDIWKMVPTAMLALEPNGHTKPRLASCASCGYEWEPRVAKPKKCPQCTGRSVIVNA